jgi:acetyl-CoA carboxylase biotin carboxyl carrier protein
MPSRPPKEKSRIDLVELQKLIRMIERSPITEFELVENDLKIRISKNGSEHTHVIAAPAMTPYAMQAAMPAMMPQAPAAIPSAPTSAASPPAGNVIEIKAPMVGTFYRAPSPDADPYVRVGDSIEPGKVLCIVEAMKLMNEIEAEVRGRIVEIMVENAQPIEFGQILFRIETSG